MNDCERLLRQERCAEQAWQGVIFRFKESPFEELAWKILGNHRKSILTLRKRIGITGTGPAAGPDLRGVMTIHLASAAALLGCRPLVAALRLAETFCVREYEHLLDRLDRSDPFRATISRSLLPRLQNHIAVLDIMAS